MGEDALPMLLRNNGVHSNAIPECIYQAKATLADAHISADYTYGSFLFDNDAGVYFFVFTKYNEAYELESLVLKQDGSIYIPDFSAIRAMNPSSYSEGYPVGDKLIVSVVANADWLTFEFDMNDPTSTGVQLYDEAPRAEYNGWNLWGANLDEFNAAEASRTN